MLPASVLCTEFELQVRQLQLAPEALAHGTNRFTHPHTLDNVIEVALRRIPIAPDLNPNFVVRHRTSFRRGNLLRDFHSILADVFRWFGPFKKLATRRRCLRPRPRVA